MYSFIISIIALVLGFVIYGRVVERVFGADAKRITPAYTMNDGVDYMPMPTWKVFLIQFLNIAGTGPVFGAIQGILFGPAAYFWIVLGCIFGGAMHDYMAGAISLRKNGASLPEIIGDELGQTARIAMRTLSLLLMVLVGAVFTTTPAGLLANMTSGWGFFGTPLFWSIVIIVYYALATLLPINKIIGRIYPIFGAILLFMAIAIFFGIFSHDGFMPEVTDAFVNHHPTSVMPIFPGICVTIACGAVSGFHATQSPLMARCLKNEKLARPVFYGSMITEGFVALIWAAASIKFASSLGADGATPYEQLWNVLTDNGAHGANPAILVNKICHSWLGSFGAILAVLGVVFAPITSGDTSFRCARLIASDFFQVRQDKMLNRILISLPIFAGSIFLMLVDFQVLWRYFAWFNQTLSLFTFWAVTVWLVKQKKCYWMSLIPGLWMTMACATYIFVAPEGFHLAQPVANALGGAFTLLLLTVFICWYRRYQKNSVKCKE